MEAPILDISRSYMITYDNILYMIIYYIKIYTIYDNI